MNVEMNVEEAVARFFSIGTGYDHNQAKMLIHWLDKCGYVVLPKVSKTNEQKGDAHLHKKAA